EPNSLVATRSAAGATATKSPEKKKVTSQSPASTVATGLSQSTGGRRPRCGFSLPPHMSGTSSTSGRPVHLGRKLHNASSNESSMPGRRVSCRLAWLDVERQLCHSGRGCSGRRRRQHTKAQHLVYHGRRYWVDAAQHLP